MTASTRSLGVASQRRRGRPAGSVGAAYAARRAERISEALRLRTCGFSYRQIGEALCVSAALAFRLVRAGFAALPAEHAKGACRLMLLRCEDLLQALWPDLDEDTPIMLGAIDNILQVQDQIMRLHDLMHGIDGADNEDERGKAILAAIKATAPVLGVGGPQVEPEHLAEARKAWRRKHLPMLPPT